MRRLRIILSDKIALATLWLVARIRCLGERLSKAVYPK